MGSRGSRGSSSDILGCLSCHSESWVVKFLQVYQQRATLPFSRDSNLFTFTLLSVRITAGSTLSLPPLKSRISWRRLSLPGSRWGSPSSLQLLPSSTLHQVQVLPSPPLQLLLLPPCCCCCWFIDHKHCIVVGHITVAIDISVVVPIILFSQQWCLKHKKCFNLEPQLFGTVAYFVVLQLNRHCHHHHHWKCHHHKKWHITSGKCSLLRYGGGGPRRRSSRILLKAKQVITL